MVNKTALVRIRRVREGALTLPLSLSELSLIEGAIAGVAGAIAGTLGGYEVRVRAARLVGKDLPVALIEDAVALGGAFLLITRG